MDTVRKITAGEMAASWQNIPHVFQFDKADVTELKISVRNTPDRWKNREQTYIHRHTS
jgi:pyruvate/2-oxoglutarate dehydrogenase complex dihydrolipoamide acyltransferase (E2) component